MTRTEAIAQLQTAQEAVSNLQGLLDDRACSHIDDQFQRQLAEAIAHLSRLRTDRPLAIHRRLGVARQ